MKTPPRPKIYQLTKFRPRLIRGRAKSVNYLQGFWLEIARDILKSGCRLFLRGGSCLNKWLKRPHIVTIRVRWVIVGLLLLNAYGHSGGKIIYADPLSPAPQIAKLDLKPLKPLPDTPLQPVELAVAAPTPEPVYVAPAAPTAPTSPDCGSDSMMAYIYTVESGCRSWAINPGGCIGLGQACPGGKLPCGLYDWGCQDAWFRNYAVAAYGSIYNAYLFRQSHNWW